MAPTAPHVKGNAHLSRFFNESVGYTLGAATDPDRTPLIASRGSKYQIFIKRISVHILTAAAQTISFRSATTDTEIVKLPASAAVGDLHILLDAEEEGIALPQGEGLEVDGAAGVQGTIEVVAYQCLAPGAVLTPSEL